MDPTSPSPFRHRLLRLSSVPTTTATSTELNEHDIFYSGESTAPPPPPNPLSHYHRGINELFPRPDVFGILAALPEQPHLNPSLSNSSSAARAIPSIPRRPADRSFQSSAKFNQSAPVKVPAMPRFSRRLRDFDDDEGEDGEMLPPHEMVGRSGGPAAPRVSCSVLEGAGRTLKGRDLRQVRNAVWRKTGFLD